MQNINYKSALYTKIQSNLWLLVGLTFPLFSVSLLRINFPYIHLAIPQILIILIGVIGLIVPRKISRNNLLDLIDKEIIILFLIFTLWHFVMLIFSNDIIFAFKNAVKVLTAFLSFVIILMFFPREEKFIKQFIIMLSVGMVILLLPLLYRYAIHFGASYLATDWDQENRVGKNQLGYFMARFSFFPLMAYLEKKLSKFVTLPTLLILLISIIYTSSRGSWVALITGILFIIYWYQKYYGTSYAIKKTFSITIKISIMILFSLFILSKFINLKTEISYRVVSMVEPSALPPEKAHLGAHSYENRSTRIRQAISGWLTSPIIGVGLGEAESYAMGLIHNDYFAVLLELGLIGLILYLSILYVITKKIFSISKLLKNTKQQIHYPWLSLCAIGSLCSQLFLSNFFDNYQTSYYWIYMGLYLVIYETDKQKIISLLQLQEAKNQE